MSQPTPHLRLPTVITEHLPAVLISVHVTAADAFLAAGCPQDLAARSADEIERQGGCTAVAATAVALGYVPFVAVRVDPDGQELAAVMKLPTGDFGLFLAAPAHATTDAVAALDLTAGAARMTGRRWLVIERERIEGFGPKGWEQ
ncbi:MAG: hypothetical protein Q8R98_27155 [Rubrivivax sp.]|nr:hypothetical protein [Rubrivivax sp.]MDP3225118.1 hypothetical protein [Rubrivivax sp.]MDP3615535.1 hypothetical protein [Rubrivivax sp.]